MLTRIRIQLHVDIDEDTRVASTVCTREADTSWCCASTAGDVDLVAAHIEPVVQ